MKTAVEAKNLDLALQLLDSIVELKPDYVEAWNRRATIYFMRKDYSRSLADMQQILAREPRHFGALSGLGLILQELGEDKRALDIYRRVLDDPSAPAAHARTDQVADREGRRPRHLIRFRNGHRARRRLMLT